MAIIEVLVRSFGMSDSIGLFFLSTISVPLLLTTLTNS